MKLFDTHCHIHEATLKLATETETRAWWVKAGSPNPDQIIKQATDAGVMGMVCVGTTADDSALAVEFVQDKPNCWASIGIHPHEAKDGGLEKLAQLLEGEASRASSLRPPAASARVAARSRPPSFRPLSTDPGAVPPKKKIVAVGECGLDYFYTHSPKEEQVKVLKQQIELALSYNLPLIFHVREAFDDFWPIVDQYKGIRGVVHSFTDSKANLDKILQRGLSVGVNGIATFTKNADQLEVYKSIPLQNLLLETDAPFLTPTPLRGRVNVPANVSLVAEFLAALRGESPKDLAEATTLNARRLFSIN